MRAKKTDLRSYVSTGQRALHANISPRISLIYLEGVQEGFDITKKLFHGCLLNVQTEKFDEFLVHCGHVFVHLNKNIDLILGAAIKTVRAVKEKLASDHVMHLGYKGKTEMKRSCATVYYSVQGGSTFFFCG